MRSPLKVYVDSDRANLVCFESQYYATGKKYFYIAPSKVAENIDLILDNI